LIGVSEDVPTAATDKESSPYPLKERLKADENYNQLNMLAFMIFVLTYLPCIATFAVVKKELGKWKYTLFLAAYTMSIAWFLAAAIFQIGKLTGLG
jgi:ferrous iron transport protein B